VTQAGGTFISPPAGDLLPTIKCFFSLLEYDIFLIVSGGTDNESCDQETVTSHPGNFV